MTQFARSVSNEGDTIVIGAYRDDDDGSMSGSAYVFTRDTAGDPASGWTQVAKLTANDGVAGDQFAGSVSNEGDTIVIGAVKDDDRGTESGSVYVFRRDTAGDLASGWTQVAKLTAGDGAANDYFGDSVSIDGDTMVIGAIRDDDNSGSAYVFTLACPGGYQGARCELCPDGYQGASCATLKSCIASSDPSEDGGDGDFYCVNGGVVGGMAGSCTCTKCVAGYGGASCHIGPCDMEKACFDFNVRNGDDHAGDLRVDGRRRWVHYGGGVHDAVAAAATVAYISCGWYYLLCRWIQDSYVHNYGPEYVYGDVWWYY